MNCTEKFSSTDSFRYGKRQLENMATVLASEDYVKDNTQHCPHCNAPIEKNEGCNKVVKELFFLLIRKKTLLTDYLLEMQHKFLLVMWC